MSLFDRTNSISKDSPSSLLPPEPKRPFFQRNEEPLPEHGPSSLLPDAPTQRYPLQEQEEVVAVSPSSLLDPQPTLFVSRWVVIGGSILALVAAFVLLALAFRGDEKPTPQLMQEALEFLSEGKDDAAAIQLKNVLLREPDNVDANLLIGKAYLGSGALLDAEKALRRARELGAPVEEVVPLLAEVLIALDRHEDALKELSDATSLKLSNARSALLRGRALLGLGNMIEARTQFTVARSEIPGEAMTGLARVMALEGDPGGALKLIDDVLAKYPSGVVGWIAKGDLLRAKGERAEALAAYRKAQSIQPDNLEATLGAAHLLINQEDFGEAHKELRKARAISPSSHLLAFATAVLAYREKRYDESREALGAVFAVTPMHMPSVLLAAALSFDAGDVEHANSAVTLYLTRFPGDVQARKLHAITLLRKQQPEAAVETLAHFVDLDIRDAEFFAVAGQAYLQVGDVKRGQELLSKAAELNPRDANVVTRLGLANLSGGLTDAGIDQLEKAVALSPKDPRADRHLAMALISSNRLDEALAVADRLEKRLPNVAEPHWLRGLVYSLRNEPRKANEGFERALQLNPAFFPAAAALARISVREGNPDAARTRFETVLKSNPKSIEARVALAELEAALGKLDEGVAIAQRAAADNPNALQAHLVLARIYLQAGKIEDALNAARRAREINPRDARAAELLGQVQLASGDSAGAVLSFTTLVNMQPRHLPGRIQLARAHRTAGDRRTAIAVARDGLAVAPRSPELLSLLGALLVEEKAYPEALKLAERAREYHPQSPIGYSLEGEIRMAQANPQQALVAFRRADELQPSGLLRIRVHQAESAMLGKEASIDPLLAWIRKAPDDLDVRIYAADALVRLGRAREAVPHYLYVLKAVPQDYRVLNNLADALMRDGDPRAVDYAQQAFQVRPDEPVVVATLGSVLLRNGKLYEAVQILQKAVQLDPSNPEIRYQFVQALAKAGDRRRARAELTSLLDSGKAFPQIVEARALVGQL